MHAQRPCTAPCRRPTSEDWTQVDAVVRDMFSTVASAATSSSALPRRPHTACACAQLVQKKAAQSSDDEESDGASIDVESDNDVQETLVRRSTAVSMSGLAWLQEQRELNGASRPSTALIAPSHPNESEGHIEMRSSLANKRSCQSPTLPPDKALLLGGQLWGKATSSTSLAPATPKNEISHTKVAVNPAERDVVAKAAAQKLPKQCLFMGFPSPGQMPSSAQKTTAKPRRGLAPAAAKLRSHVSWAHHLPMRTSQHLTNSSASADTTASEPSHGIRPEQTAGSNATVEPAKDVAMNSEPVSHALTDLVAPVEAPTDEPPSRKRGPRYYFAPGSSRPMRAPQHAPKRDVMVLEFRTEPRIVPASRAPPKHSERRSEAFRFRPKSREWAAQREVIAMH